MSEAQDSAVEVKAENRLANRSDADKSSTTLAHTHVEQEKEVDYESNRSSAFTTRESSLPAASDGGLQGWLAVFGW